MLGLSWRQLAMRARRRAVEGRPKARSSHIYNEAMPRYAVSSPDRRQSSLLIGTRRSRPRVRLAPHQRYARAAQKRLTTDITMLGTRAWAYIEGTLVAR
jgi:hypothetical protein